MNWKLIYQGLARIIDGPETEAQLLAKILKTPIADGEWFSKTACAAMLLSRSDSAPLSLDRAQVDMLAERAIAEMQALIGTPFTTNLYSRFLVGGLLRWRQVSPYAFLPGSDPYGDRLVAAIGAVLADLAKRARYDPGIERARARYGATFEGLKAEIIGEGSSPDLLLNIYETS